MKDFLPLFPAVDTERIVRMIRRPEKDAEVVLDTDTYNEIDDQYCLAYLVASEPRVRLAAVTAAPFWRDPREGVSRSADPADGMEKSYDEILHVLSLMGRDDLKGRVEKGSTRYLPSETEAVDSPAARAIIDLSRGHTEEDPLYVLAIGCITNVASALLLDPTLVSRIVVVFLGGHGLHIGCCTDFNMKQDIAAARVVFGCGVPLVQFPCLGVVSEFRFSRPELEYWFRGRNAVCDYLIDNTYAFTDRSTGRKDWSKPIWDAVTVAWLREGDFFDWRLIPSPIPEYDRKYGFDPGRHPIGYVYYVHKDAIIRDLAAALGGLKDLK